MSELMSAETVARKLNLYDADAEDPLARFHTLRNRNSWPCIKFGRNDWRFTEQDYADILDMQRRGGRKQQKPAETRAAIKGQTTRSAARGRR